MNVEGLQRDEMFLEKSVEAIKARNEELEPHCQTLQVSQAIALYAVLNV